MDVRALLNGVSGLAPLLSGQPVIPGQAPPQQPPPSALDMAGASAAPPSTMDGIAQIASLANAPQGQSAPAPSGPPPQAQPQAPPQAQQPQGPMTALEQQQATIANRSKQPFLTRLAIPEQVGGLSFWDKAQDASNAILDATQGTDRSDRAQRGRIERQQMDMELANRQALFQQIDTMYPDNARMRFMLKANPTKAAEIMMQSSVPTKLGKGERLVDPQSGHPVGGGIGAGAGQGGGQGADIVDYGVEGGVPWTMHGDGSISWGEARPENAAELETGRHNGVEENQGGQRIGLDQKRLGVEGARLGIEGQRAQLDQTKFNFDKMTAAQKLHPDAVVATSQAQVQALKPGTKFIAPDGSVKVR